MSLQRKTVSSGGGGSASEAWRHAGESERPASHEGLHGWQLLVVSENRDRRRQLMAACQSPRLPGGVAIEVADVDELIQQLRAQYVDCVLLDLPLLDNNWLTRLQPLGEQLRGAFCLVVAQRSLLDPQQDLSTATWLRVLPGEPLESDRVITQLHDLAVAMGYKQATGDGPDVRGRHDAANLRNDERYEVVRPMMAIPVTAGDLPQREGTVYGYTTDFSLRGLRFHLPSNTGAVPQRWVIGVEQTDGQMSFATVITRNVTRDTSGQLVIGTEIVRDTRDLFFDTNLHPQFDPISLRIQTGLSEQARCQWVELGVLEPYFLDYVMVCPECEGLITWRRGCTHCGGAQVQCQQLIHHYACAHVGPVSTFEQATGLVCPKCRIGNLVIGVDFEYQNGEFVCDGCNWTDSHLEDVAHCLRCHLRFPGQQAVEKELLGYHFRRLDPLAIIGSA
ncbi:MAG: hypothetical protein U0795_08865 [Pirellulales bacterium]